MANIRYQAQRDGQMSVHEEITNDAEKAALALAMHEKENEGAGHRKRKIEWQAYCRSAGLRMSETWREKD
eukprot:6490530-Amphidinium_carterae.2